MSRLSIKSETPTVAPAPSFKLPIIDCHDLTSLAAYLLAGHISECFYECGCSHGRCSYPSEHNYFDIAEFKAVNDRLCEVGASFTSRRLKRETTRSDITLHIHDTVTVSQLAKILKLNAEHRVYRQLPRSASNILLSHNPSLVIVDDKLYEASLIR